MKKILTSLLLISMYMPAMSQTGDIVFAKKSKEPVTISDGTVLSVGSGVQLGIGQQNDGDFKYVKILSSFNEALGFASSSFNTKTVVIKFFKLQQGKPYVYTHNLVIDIESAIATGEVITEASKNKSPKQATQATGSITDELKKLKDLLDSGAITQGEYESFKKKLLGN